MREDEFRTLYKKAVDSMQPGEEMKNRLSDKMEQRQERKRPRKTFYVAASLVLAAGIGLAAPNILQQWNGPASTSQSAQADNGIFIPKIELPKGDSGVAMSMVPLVVYKANIYTAAPTRIDADTAAQLRGEKLGRTTGGIDEWSGTDDYTELASNIGETDIFAVKGYDTDFRIMSYTEINGEVYADLYEHTNGITVASGADLVGKLNLEGRIASAEWESFESWNNGQQVYAPLATGEEFDGFLNALLAAEPLAAEPLIEQGIYDSEDRKIIYLQLEDGTRAELTLFGQELVRYGQTPVFFKVDSTAFQALWNSMNP